MAAAAFTGSLETDVAKTLEPLPSQVLTLAPVPVPVPIPVAMVVTGATVDPV